MPFRLNHSIAQSTADIIFAFDDDTLMYPDCAKEILRIYAADVDHRIVRNSGAGRDMPACLHRI